MKQIISTSPFGIPATTYALVASIKRDPIYDYPKALLELVHNSVDSGAKNIVLNVVPDEFCNLTLSFCDNGTGMVFNTEEITSKIFQKGLTIHSTSTKNKTGMFNSGMKESVFKFASLDYAVDVTIASKHEDSSAWKAEFTIDPNSDTLIYPTIVEISDEEFMELNNGFSTGFCVKMSNIDNELHMYQRGAEYFWTSMRNAIMENLVLWCKNKGGVLTLQFPNTDVVTTMDETSVPFDSDVMYYSVESEQYTHSSETMYWDLGEENVIIDMVHFGNKAKRYAMADIEGEQKGGAIFTAEELGQVLYATNTDKCFMEFMKAIYKQKTGKVSGINWTNLVRFNIRLGSRLYSEFIKCTSKDKNEPRFDMKQCSAEALNMFWEIAQFINEKAKEFKRDYNQVRCSCKDLYVGKFSDENLPLKVVRWSINKGVGDYAFKVIEDTKHGYTIVVDSNNRVWTGSRDQNGGIDRGFHTLLNSHESFYDAIDQFDHTHNFENFKRQMESLNTEHIKRANRLDNLFNK